MAEEPADRTQQAGSLTVRTPGNPAALGIIESGRQDIPFLPVYHMSWIHSNPAKGRTRTCWLNSPSAIPLESSPELAAIAASSVPVMP